MKKILSFFNTSKKESDFAEFITNASSKKKKQVFSGVIKDANNDQKRLFEKHKKNLMSI